eukprot:TRINITY_DN720_c0_g1_i1.p1 TRINITY_DN720_c0_g1~~TRINITY_DN720_c0_g1_i1.p1  ORF type:complete len:1026 (+),score=322.14 TRINITY_DN720_c0_g1_i1:237-3314(+)
MSDSQSVKVAVRVRPFNQREKDRNSTCIISMSGPKTTIQDPETKKTKSFSFDFSYWSHDGFHSEGQLLVKDSPKYADQADVFKDLGESVLDNAWKGYNCSLFAYGQTGSGKSFSVVGYGPNKGIVPITCERLFGGIDKVKGDPMKKFEVFVSMLEIYNENVRDLLTTKNPPGGLKIRENPKVGVYVEKLTKAPVSSYEEIESKTDEGVRNRTVASTNMNATSSRAHTVITISFAQISKNDAGEPMERKSKINLVDLAGSERADSTGATGDRLKEGAMINQSLSSLGNVISALADQSMGKKKVFIPYRNSALTRILQDALGGNSKTIMIAALSPADINYEETLSTLRYADRAKKIKNKAVVNENPTDKLIRELKEENERLMKMLQGKGGPVESAAGASPEEVERLRKEMEEEMAAKLEENRRLMEEQAQSFEEKMKAVEEEKRRAEAEKAEAKNRTKSIPHLINLNEDAQLSGVIMHFFDEEQIRVGRKDADVPPQIKLSGLSIAKEHAKITVGKKQISIEPVNQAKTLVNGEPLTEKHVLQAGDRLLFGNNHLYIYVDPKVSSTHEVTWEEAQAEIAKAQGLATNAIGVRDKDLTPAEIEQRIINDDVVTLLPMVNEANAIAEELGKEMNFAIKIVSSDGKKQIAVRMKDMLTQSSWMWPREKMLNRSFLMREMYQHFMEYGEPPQVAKEKDPFWEPPGEILIGNVNVQLSSLSYRIEIEETLSIVDYKGKSEGTLRIEILPCDKKGNTKNEGYDEFVDDPNDLVGKELNFIVHIPHVRGINSKYNNGVRCKYKFYLDEKQECTEVVKGTINPDFQYKKMYKFKTVTKQMLEYLENGSMTIEVWGTQIDRSDLKEKKKHRPSSRQTGKSGESEEVERLRRELEEQKLANQKLQQAAAGGKGAVPPLGAVPAPVPSGAHEQVTARRVKLQERVETLQKELDMYKANLADTSAEGATPRRNQLQNKVQVLLRERAELEAKVDKMSQIERILERASQQDDPNYFATEASKVLGKPLPPAKKSGACSIL